VAVDVSKRDGSGEAGETGGGGGSAGKDDFGGSFGVFVGELAVGIGEVFGELADAAGRLGDVNARVFGATAGEALEALPLVSHSLANDAVDGSGGEEVFGVLFEVGVLEELTGRERGSFGATGGVEAEDSLLEVEVELVLGSALHD
jgi:hypothetical protein